MLGDPPLRPPQGGLGWLRGSGGSHPRGSHPSPAPRLQTPLSNWGLGAAESGPGRGETAGGAWARPPLPQPGGGPNPMPRPPQFGKAGAPGDVSLHGKLRHGAGGLEVGRAPASWGGWTPPPQGWQLGGDPPPQVLPASGGSWRGRRRPPPRSITPSRCQHPCPAKPLSPGGGTRERGVLGTHGCWHSRIAAGRAGQAPAALGQAGAVTPRVSVSPHPAGTGDAGAGGDGHRPCHHPVALGGTQGGTQRVPGGGG